jgi:hypothetical protein
VLANFKAKIVSTIGDTCIFVSTDPAKPLKLLREKLPAAHEVEACEKSLSGEEQTQWHNLQQQLDFDAQHSSDWLARSDFLTFPESKLVSALAAELERWFTSPPADVMAALRSWTEDDGNFNRALNRTWQTQDSLGWNVNSAEPSDGSFTFGSLQIIRPPHHQLATLGKILS